MPLIEKLKRRDEESYWHRPETRTQLKYGAVAIFAFLIALKLFG